MVTQGKTGLSLPYVCSSARTADTRPLLVLVAKPSQVSNRQNMSLSSPEADVDTVDNRRGRAACGCTEKVRRSGRLPLLLMVVDDDVKVQLAEDWGTGAGACSCSGAATWTRCFLERLPVMPMLWCVCVCVCAEKVCVLYLVDEVRDGGGGFNSC